MIWNGRAFRRESVGERMSDELENTGQNDDAQEKSDTLAECNVTQEEIDKLNSRFAPKLWLEVLPSQTGTILAAILTNIMTEGLTPNQENILGNFISSVGTLISYKASRDDLDINGNP